MKPNTKLERKRRAYYRQSAGRHYAPGDPRYIRIYDDGGETTDRYTVVFTRRIEGYYFGLGMSECPTSPQGVGQHLEYRHRIDWPSYAHLGKRIGFGDLPKACQRLVWSDYVYLYDLDGQGEERLTLI